MSKASSRVVAPREETSTDSCAEKETISCFRCTRRRKVIIASLVAVVALILLGAGVAVAVLRGSGAPNIKLNETSQSASGSTAAGTQQVFVGASTLEAMMAEPQSVTVLDARPSNPSAVLLDPAWGKTIPGSVSVKWGDFTSNGGRGDLIPPEEQKAIFEEKGVSSDVPVVVYGGWSSKFAWGEEGRIYWQLDYLGHKNVSILYGGIYGWHDGTERKGMANPSPGNLEVFVQDNERAESSGILQELNAGVADGSIVLLDAREDQEFEGSTPYGSPRGGHIPGAVSYNWRKAFDMNGNLRSKEDLLSDLEKVGVLGNTTVIPYCTGGVRSAFLYAVLRWAGISSVANYDGSWWDWSGNPNLPVVSGSLTGGSAIGRKLRYHF